VEDKKKRSLLVDLGDSSSSSEEVVRSIVVRD
jgi:hypothetical protein